MQLSKKTAMGLQAIPYGFSLASSARPPAANASYNSNTNLFEWNGLVKISITRSGLLRNGSPYTACSPKAHGSESWIHAQDSAPVRRNRQLAVRASARCGGGAGEITSRDGRPYIRPGLAPNPAQTMSRLLSHRSVHQWCHGPARSLSRRLTALSLPGWLSRLKMGNSLRYLMVRFEWGTNG